MYEIILMYICTYVRLVCHKLMDYSQQRDIEQTDGRTHVCIYLKMCVYLLLYCRCCCCRRHRYWRSRSFCYCFYSLLCLASSPSKRPTSCLLFLISLQRYYDVCIWLCVCMCVFPFSYKRMEYTYVCMCVCHHYHCLLLVFLLLWSHISFWSLLFFLVAERTSAQWFPFCLQILAYLCDCVCACECMFTWIWELFCVNVIFVMSIPLFLSLLY